MAPDIATRDVHDVREGRHVTGIDLEKHHVRFGRQVVRFAGLPQLMRHTPPAGPYQDDWR